MKAGGRRVKQKLLVSIMICIFIGSLLNAASAHAAVFERMKEIYHAPEKVEELQAHVREATQQIEESKRQAEQLLQQNAALQKQTEVLTEQNKQLQSRLEEMASERQTLYRQLTSTGITAILLLVGYAAAVRIWRYTVWRKQRREDHEVTTL
jgi:regulator of replication initiation timing